MPQPDARITRASAARFARSFWLPPRAHGERIEGREVSFLELFYDLVYVVVVSQASHHLAVDVSWSAAGQFAVVFGLVWIAWINGASYHDLHGRSDGRTRTYVFAQMGLLVVLAVFTTEAPDADGAPFAVAYAAYLALLAWLWWTVRRQDDADTRPLTTPYIAGVVGSAILMGASVPLPAAARMWVWGALVLGWLVGLAVIDWRHSATRDTSANVTESMIERVDLFTIIVLGEVVVGVVNGLAGAGRTTGTIVTGVLGLGIGFAYWWSYFDFVGARRVRTERGALSRWLLGHFPVALSIAATGGILAG